MKQLNEQFAEQYQSSWTKIKSLYFVVAIVFVYSSPNRFVLPQWSEDSSLPSLSPKLISGVEEQDAPPAPVDGRLLRQQAVRGEPCGGGAPALGPARHPAAGGGGGGGALRDLLPPPPGGERRGQVVPPLHSGASLFQGSPPPSTTRKSHIHQFGH